MQSLSHISPFPLPFSVETPRVLRQLISTHRALAELRGLAQTLPNEHILISTLPLQEARESSLVENIVTTQDDLYHADLEEGKFSHLAAKEVYNYRDALYFAYRSVQERPVITTSLIVAIQEHLEQNRGGLRAVPGTALRRSDGAVIYTPPQDKQEIVELLDNLVQFINDETLSDLDPLVKIAMAHHQFESIHPFYDGNGRTGRILNILLLVFYDLLDQPILYLSRYITQHKATYYQRIQDIRDADAQHLADAWEAWVLFMLRGVEETAHSTAALVKEMVQLMAHFKKTLRQALPKVYSHELLNNLFRHPYTKIDFLQQDLGVSRQTASRYLDQIVELGLLEKTKNGKENYYINHTLIKLFSERGS